MAARAMWKSVLRIDEASVPVKLYSAVQDHDIRFRMLDRTGKELTPVTQAMVHPETEDVVPYEETQRGYVSDEGDLVVLDEDELASLAPEESRDIVIERFLPTGAIDPQWYDRPYYLGPDRSASRYAALTTALGRSGREGLARWVMRKKEYVGALRAQDDHLVLVSLRHAGEVVPVESLNAPTGDKLDAKEVEMAHQLMQMLEADFNPEEYRDQYRDRLLELIEAKSQGKKPKLEVVKPKAQSLDLRKALAASLRGARATGEKSKEKKRAKA
jgi:DNA end-binding protein Ku